MRIYECMSIPYYLKELRMYLKFHHHTLPIGISHQFKSSQIDLFLGMKIWNGMLSGKVLPG